MYVDSVPSKKLRVIPVIYAWGVIGKPLAPDTLDVSSWFFYGRNNKFFKNTDRPRRSR